MKSIHTCVAAIMLLLLASCDPGDIFLEPETAKVKIRIEYLGAGGYYNDNMDAVPYNLALGVNGPFEVDPDATYKISYKADYNFPEVQLNWTPVAGQTWVIHCFVENNIEYIRTYAE